MKVFLRCIKAIGAFLGTLVIGSLLAFVIFGEKRMPDWFMAVICISAVAAPFWVVIMDKRKKQGDHGTKKVGASYTSPSDTPDENKNRIIITGVAGQKNCKRCGKEFTDGDRIHDYCRGCWCIHLQQLREFCRPYETRLLAVLEEKGIRADPGTVSGLDETGRPSEAVGETESPMSLLGESEHALRLLRVRDAVLALAEIGYPEDSLGLRCILPSADGGFMKRIGSLCGDDNGRLLRGKRRFLAAVSDGAHVYALSEDGMVYHTNPSIAGPIPVSSRLELHREIWRAFFTDEQLRASAAKLSDPQGGIMHIICEAYFDTAQKMFFEVSAYGSYHDGYDVSYPRLTKEETIDRLLRNKALFQTWDQCRRGDVPMAAMVELAEEAPQDMEYVPQPHFGWGVHYY